MTADELLKLVYDTNLGRESHLGDEQRCQFCGCGPENPFVSPIHPEQGPHLPSCLWPKIEAYLKGIGR